MSQDEMAALLSETEQDGAAAKIRKFWEQVVSWFRKEPGEAQVTQTEAKESEGG